MHNFVKHGEPLATSLRCWMEGSLRVVDHFLPVRSVVVLADDKQNRSSLNSLYPVSVLSGVSVACCAGILSMSRTKALKVISRLFNRAALILRLREPVWPSGKALAW